MNHTQQFQATKSAAEAFETPRLMKMMPGRVTVNKMLPRTKISILKTANMTKIDLV